jgi:dsRNA-specific ribonuclease
MKDWKTEDVCLQWPPFWMGKNMGEGKAFNKKDASQIAAQIAVEKLGIVNTES